MSTNIGCRLEQPLPSGRGSGRCNRRRFLPDLCRNRLQRYSRVGHVIAFEVDGVKRVSSKLGSFCVSY